MYQWCDLFSLLVEIICEDPPPPSLLDSCCAAEFKPGLMAHIQ